ncbi:hypothetical protein AB4Z48_05070 [Cupriavidus sp. 2TAF22]|uniref:hypothetical protein n=1 Tax=unclassified Cupriavidus TaxID=2640874 RepID=UPI003F9211EE
MSDHPRYTLNRSLVILVPQQPFFDWIMAVDTDPVPSLTLENVREDQSAFLAPDEISNAPQAVQWVEERWRAFFEFMLGEWFEESVWPQNLTLEQFREWFTVQHHSTVFDMATDFGIEHEDWEAEEEDEDEGDGESGLRRLH